ncbi:MarR family transcriptional regulator [Rhodobacterales bacterium HKCCE2091]|nr:MarR family transcriptional regulator [Rhodobacterales bacterium HKCCE2091]
MDPTLETFLPYRLNRLSEAVSLRVRPIYAKRFGLTRPEWRVLAALADLGQATATIVGAHSTQHKTKVSRAVFALEERRWLVRTQDPRDRRSDILSLTEAGLRAYRELLLPMRQVEAEMLSHLDPADRAALQRGLAALESVVLESSSDASGPDAAPASSSSAS